MKKTSKNKDTKNITLEVENAVIHTTSSTIDLEPYSTFDVCRIVGISKERFREWIIRDYIEPSIQKAKGQRRRAKFSKDDLYRIALFKNLIEESGFSRKTASQFVQSMPMEPMDNLENINCIMFIQRNLGSSGSKIDCRIISDIDEIQKSITEASPDWDSFFIVNLKKIKNEVTVNLSE